MGHLLHLVRGVSRFEVRAQCPALYCLCQNDRRLTVALRRGLIGGEEFAIIMATALEAPNLLIAPICYESSGAWIATEEMLAHISATFGFKCLVIAIGRAIH